MEAPELRDHLAARLGGRIERSVIARGELSVEIVPGDLLPVMKFLRDDPACAFTILIDLCGVDYPERPARFEVVYHLLSITQNHRLRVRLAAGEQTPVPSLVPLFPAADWYEREAFDLYGILFSGHPDLRRILTDYGFEGHPLRKDFPLTGFAEVRYDDMRKEVVYEPVSLAQEYRNFDFISPWKGMNRPALRGAGQPPEKGGSSKSGDGEP